MFRRIRILIFALVVISLAAPAQAEAGAKIIINKKINKLAFYQNGSLVQEFPVATGRKPSYTPEGSFKVVTKAVRPYYSKLGIKGGSPANPLGERWLGLNAGGTSGGTYGIHGTNNPASIGTYASSGCIRMFNQDVIWLYNHTPINTPVLIVNEDQPFSSGSWVTQEAEPDRRPVALSINGNVLKQEPLSSAYLQEGRVMVPCRLVAETMGWEISWDSAAHKVTLDAGGRMLQFAVNSSAAAVGQEVRTMPLPAVVKNGLSFVPIRTLAEAFGLGVVWDGSTQTAILMSQTGSSPRAAGIH